MPTAILLGCAALGLILWLRHKRPSFGRYEIAQAMRAFAAVFGSLATTGLAIGGRYGLAVVTLIATMAALRSLFEAWRGARPFGGSAKESTTQTAYLKMRLDHDSGEMDGAVTAGAFAGALLSLMSIEQLLTLRDEIRLADEQSLPLVEAYLDHAHPDWRIQGSFETDYDEGTLSESKALEILGLKPGATIEDVKKAHRSLMTKIHPDRGGDPERAAQVNAAKQLLEQLLQH